MCDVKSRDDDRFINSEGGVGKIFQIILVFITLVAVRGWLKWYLTTISILHYYVETLGYEEPETDKLRDSVMWVVSHFINDLKYRMKIF